MNARIAADSAVASLLGIPIRTDAWKKPVHPFSSTHECRGQREGLVTHVKMRA
jgi:hypothetical protein